MGSNQRQRKSSSFMSVFNIFKSKNKGGGYYNYYDDDDEGRNRMGWKVWASDEDRGHWGPADPVIDMKAAAFIAQYRKKVTESEVHHLQAHQLD
ncbi:hypothetical protein G2W53_023481 [Senna tora]|uniref:Uncharacterized protein n=1 Tax=Senna tora TaxID=362788 RepID=A0A834TBI7_9FABA|nr:hypothetical protein G2W53_023481 [Senna tora]